MSNFNIKNSHPKLIETTQRMLIDLKYAMPFYGEYNLYINFQERKDIPTAGVNVTQSGMNFYWNREFIDSLTQKQCNFLVLHEDFHLLFDHPQRTVSGKFDHKIANVVQDMIINTIIWEDISHKFIDIPKDVKGNNSALFIPKEYEGEPIFELLYVWLKEKRDEKRKQQNDKSQCQTCNGSDQQGQPGQGQPGQGQGNQPCPDCGGSPNGKDDKGNNLDSNGKPEYGPYSQDMNDGKPGPDTYSLDSIIDNMDSNDGQFMDSHLQDEVPAELRDSMVKEVIQRLKARGLEDANIESTLGKLRKKKKDYLKEIKRSISNEMFGQIKDRTIARPNRRGILGLKGNRKIKTEINVVLDTSGSMTGLFEKVLNYIYQNDITINLIQIDTKVKSHEKIKKQKDMNHINCYGGGGTVLQPSINYIVKSKELKRLNTVFLTDGYTDSLNFQQYHGKVLIVSAGENCPISVKPKKGLKQILIEKTK